MRPIHLFDITSRHNQWLAARRSVIASNIANANTPGYEAVDLQSFSDVLDATGLEMAATARGHQMPDTTASVTTGDGELLYTRAGSSNKNAEGQIVTVDGYVVQPAMTVPIATDIIINQTGEVFVRIGNDPT